MKINAISGFKLTQTHTQTIFWLTLRINCDHIAYRQFEMPMAASFSSYFFLSPCVLSVFWCLAVIKRYTTIHNDTIDIWIEMPYAIHCSVFSILISRKTDYIYRRSNTQHRLASISVMLSSCFQLVYLWLCSTIHGINTTHERTKGNVCRDREKDKEQTTITCICV